jgi:hypothetical protein
LRFVIANGEDSVLYYFQRGAEENLQQVADAEQSEKTTTVDDGVVCAIIIAITHFHMTNLTRSRTDGYYQYEALHEGPQYRAVKHGFLYYPSFEQWQQRNSVLDEESGGRRSTCRLLVMLSHDTRDVPRPQEPLTERVKFLSRPGLGFGEFRLHQLDQTTCFRRHLASRNSPTVNRHRVDPYQRLTLDCVVGSRLYAWQYSKKLDTQRVVYTCPWSLIHSSIEAISNQSEANQLLQWWPIRPVWQIESRTRFSEVAVNWLGPRVAVGKTVLGVIGRWPDAEILLCSNTLNDSHRLVRQVPFSGKIAES